MREQVLALVMREDSPLVKWEVMAADFGLSSNWVLLELLEPDFPLPFLYLACLRPLDINHVKHLDVVRLLLAEVLVNLLEAFDEGSLALPQLSLVYVGT